MNDFEPLKTRIIWIIILLPYLILFVDILALFLIAFFQSSFIELIKFIGNNMVYIIKITPSVEFDEWLPIISGVTTFILVSYILHSNSNTPHQRRHVIISSGVFIFSIYLAGTLIFTLFAIGISRI